MIQYNDWCIFKVRRKGDEDLTSEQRDRLDKLYLAMFQSLFEFALARLGDESLAEEAVQEAFQIACQKPDALWASPNPAGWVMNTLKNVISNQWKRQKTEQRFRSDVSVEMLSRCGVEDSINPDLLHWNVSSSPEYRMIRAVTLDGKTYPELSRELGITLAACRKRMQRAKEYLKKKMK